MCGKEHEIKANKFKLELSNKVTLPSDFGRPLHDQITTSWRYAKRKINVLLILGH